MKNTLRVAIAAMAIASLLTACGKKSNSVSSNIAPADNSTAANHSSNIPSPVVYPTLEGSANFGGVTKADGSVITETQLSEITNESPEVASGLAIVQSATSVSVTADGTITLSDASGTLAVVRADGSVISSRAAFPVVAVGITQVHGSGDKAGQGECQEQVHFTMQQSAQNSNSKEQSASSKEQAANKNQQQKEEKSQAATSAVSTWVVTACPTPQQEQKGQEQGKTSASNSTGKEQGKAEASASATPCPKEQPGKESPGKESKEQPTPAPTAQPKQEQSKQGMTSSEQSKQSQSSSGQTQQKK